MARQITDTNLPETNLQVTSAPVAQSVIPSGKGSKASRLAQALSGFSKGLSDSLSSISDISNRNAQAEIDKMNTENRVRNEAQQELRARISLRKQEIAKEEAERQKADAARQKAERLAAARQEALQKKADEDLKLSNEQARSKLILASTGKSDLSGTGETIASMYESDNREGAQGLADVVLQNAMGYAKTAVDTQRQTIGAQDLSSFDAKGSYLNALNESLAAHGVTTDMLSLVADPDTLEKALAGSIDSQEDLIKDRVNYAIQQRDDAASGAVGSYSVQMRRDILGGAENPLGKFISTIQDPRNTMGVPFDSNDVEKSTVGAIRSFAEQLELDETLTPNQASSRLDSLVQEARRSGAEVTNSDSFRKSVKAIKDTLVTRMSNTQVEATIELDKTVKGIDQFSATNDAVDFISSNFTFADGREFTVDGFRDSDYGNVYFNGRPVPQSYMKSMNLKIESIRKEERDSAIVKNGIHESMSKGVPVKDKYGSVVVTEARKRETINTLMTDKETGEFDMGRITSAYLTGSLANERFTPEIQQYLSIDTSSPENLKNSYMRLKEFQSIGGEEPTKWKLGARDKDFLNYMDQIVSRNPSILNSEDPAAFESILGELANGRKYTDEMQKQFQTFKSSEGYRSEIENIYDEDISQAALFGLIGGINIGEVKNRPLINAEIEAAARDFYAINGGITEGFSDYASKRILSKHYIDTVTKELVPLPGNSFSSSEAMSNALSTAKDYVTDDNLGITSPETIARIGSMDRSKVRFTRSPFSNDAMIAKYQDENGMWVNVLRKDNSPVQIRTSDLAKIANKYESYSSKSSTTNVTTNVSAELNQI